ncbi:MAG: zonular occludens toxin domain-containing protein [Aeromonadaceae bacterium]
MIFFLEGMPGSGKSYESMSKHIIPALQKGRAIDAYLYGLDHEKIASLAGIDIDQCKELLRELTTEEASEVWKHARDNALVVLDEAHKFWPSGRVRPSPEMCDLVAEHRHRGMDMLFMSQTFGSVHTVIQDRTNKKITFNKLDAVGQENRYNWVAFQGTLNTRGNRTFVTFSKMGSGMEKYDSKYFGTYKSHVSEDIQTDNYKDERFNIFNRKSLRYGLPALFIVGIFCIYHVYRWLSGAVLLDKEAPKTEVTVTENASAKSATQAPPVLPVKPQPRELDDYIYQSLKGKQHALTYLAVLGNRVMDFWVDVQDSDGNTLEVWRMADFEHWKYKITLTPSGILAVKDGVSLLLRERYLPNYVPPSARDNKLDMSASNPIEK